MSKVTTLRLTSSLPPPRSPAREALAHAIERHAAATRAAEHVARAQDRAHELVLKAGSDLERAEAVLASALELTTGRALADELLGRGPAPSTAEAARRVVEAASAAWATTRAARDALEADRAEADAELRMAASTRDSALMTLVKSSPDIAAAMAEVETARCAYINKLDVVNLLMGRSFFGYEERAAITAANSRPVPDGAETMAWRAWLAALETDAEAVLSR